MKPLLVMLGAWALSSHAGCSQPSRSTSTPSAVEATTVVAPTRVGRAQPVEVEPASSPSHQRLLTALRAAVPACTMDETVSAAETSGSSYVHFYFIQAPSLAQADLEARFRGAAKDIGYPLQQIPVVGLGFSDEGKHVSGSVGDGTLSVFGPESEGPRAYALRFAAEEKLDTLSLYEALGEGATWRSSRSSRGDSTELQAKVVVSASQRQAVDAWARKQKLTRGKKGWLRRHEKNGPSSIVIDLEADGDVWVVESRAGDRSGPACAFHSTRDAKKGPAPSGPEPTDDELLRIMKGK